MKEKKSHTGNNGSRTTKVIKIGGGSLLLGAISLASVGFASYIAINSPSFSNQAAINAAEIKKVDIFEEISIKTFKFGKEGIVDSDPLISVSLTINNEYLSSFSYLDSDNVFTMKTTLTPSDADFLPYIDSLSITNIKGCTIGTIVSESSKQNTLSLTIDANESETKLGLTYSIKTKVNDVGIGTFVNRNLSVSFNAEGIRPAKEANDEA